jgi:hypothetical protein
MMPEQSRLDELNQILLRHEQLRPEAIRLAGVISDRLARPSYRSWPGRVLALRRGGSYRVSRVRARPRSKLYRGL